MKNGGIKMAAENHISQIISFFSKKMIPLLGSHENAIIEVPEIIYESEKAILVEVNDRRVWLPKSQITIKNKKGKKLKIEVSRWFYRRKFSKKS
jgi:hypothetical protein